MNSHLNFKATALEEETLRKQAPSIFALGPMSGVSARYTFVPTARIVSGLRALDWVPVAVEEQRIRTEARRGFQKHLIRFRRAEQMETLDEWNVELVLVNSHDAGCAYQIHAGIFRRICSNGLVISETGFEAIRFRHAGLEADEVVQSSLRLLEYMPRIGELVQRFRERLLDERECLALAGHALRLRYASLDEAPVEPATLLQSRRPEDEGSDLWRVTNRLQEQKGADKLLDTAIATIGPQTKSGSGSLGPFVASYSIIGTLTSGDIDLIPPDTIRIVDLKLDWSLSFSFGFDLSSILPDFCLPQVCVDIPCLGTICTPKICIDWPTISIPVSFSDFLKATADLKLAINLVGGTWKVEAVLLGLPSLSFGATSAALLLAIGAAATPILLAIPFIGPFLAIAVNAILAAIALAGVTGFLGPIITPFISGLRVSIYDQPQLFEVLPATSPVDPKVDIVLDLIAAGVQHNGLEDELVLTADISP